MSVKSRKIGYQTWINWYGVVMVGMEVAYKIGSENGSCRVASEATGRNY